MPWAARYLQTTVWTTAATTASLCDHHPQVEEGPVYTGPSSRPGESTLRRQQAVAFCPEHGLGSVLDADPSIVTSSDTSTSACFADADAIASRAMAIQTRTFATPLLCPGAADEW